MRKDTLAISPAAPRRTYVSPAITVFTLSPCMLMAGSPLPDVPVDEEPGGEALSPELDIFDFPTLTSYPVPQN